jgi:hypothetical protein
MELIIYFATVFPVGMLLLYLAIRYDHLHVPTAVTEPMPVLNKLFKELKDRTNE